MGLLAVLRRRLGAHPVALIAVALSVLTSMLVVAALQLVVGRISEAGVDNVLAADPAERSVAVRGTVETDGLAAADAAVRRHLSRLGPGTTVTRVATSTVRGISGEGARARAQVAEATGARDSAELVEGAWPDTRGDLPGVAIPQGTAAALELGVGDVVSLPDLVDPGAAPLRVRVSGLFLVRDADDPVWADLPLAPRGVDPGTDYQTYGPFLLREGILEEGGGSITVIWRAAPDLAAVSPGSIDEHADRARRVVASVARAVGASVDGVPQSSAEPLLQGNAAVESGLGPLLEDAGALTDRIRATLLTPTVLLVLLAMVALTVAGGLLASLREADTRLLRIRGASTRQLSVMSGVEALVVGAGGAVVALGLAPLLVRALGVGQGSYLKDALAPRALAAVGLMAVLAVLVIVGTTMRLSRVLGVDRGGRGGGAGLRMLAGSGLDVPVVGLGVVAALQLRRYADSSRETIDPLTTLAPALVIGGLSLLALRLLPVLSHRIAGLTSRSARLSVAWGGWQLSRRLAAQGGTILLVLLAVAMGDLALAHGSTSARAYADQERARVGAAVRVDQDFLRAEPARAASIYEGAAGGAARVMPVLRTSIELGDASGVDLLAVDAATAGSVVSPRPDTLDGQAWPGLMDRLAKGRRLGGAVKVPGRPATLSVEARIAGASASQLASFGADREGRLPARLLVRDARGLVWPLSLGALGPRRTRLSAETAPDLSWPVSVVAVVAQTSVAAGGPPPSGSEPRIEVSRLRADGRDVGGADRLRAREGLDPLVASADAVPAAPGAVITRGVADAGGLEVGETLRADLPGRSVDLSVTAIVSTLPTARDPGLALIADLPSILASSEAGEQDRVPSVATLAPQEWWLDPVDAEAAVQALRAEPLLVGEVHSVAESVSDRESDPVNTGMRASMWLVTAAALGLAALGFAAATVALRRVRRRDSVVLMSLGMAPSVVRSVLLWERVLVVVAATLTGSAIGWLAGLVVVPVLVGGDGVTAVPPVQLVIPLDDMLLLGLGVIVLLATVAAVVLARVRTDLPGELRRMEA